MLTKTIQLILGFVILFSCSNLVESTRESLLSGKKRRDNSKQEVKWVSKAQYDDLMVKYKDLNQRYENLKENKITAPAPQADETIDVFAEANKKAQAEAAPVKKSSAVVIDVEKIDEEIDYYKRAKLLYQSGKQEEALKIFQFLEKARSKQIQVRSKRYIGDIYFSKNQFDLALQVYESIIRQYSFSGRVIPALKNAMKCSEKLGLTDKQEQYQSMLSDFFGIQV